MLKSYHQITERDARAVVSYKDYAANAETGSPAFTDAYIEIGDGKFIEHTIRVQLAYKERITTNA